MQLVCQRNLYNTQCPKYRVKLVETSFCNEYLRRGTPVKPSPGTARLDGADGALTD